MLTNTEYAPGHYGWEMIQSFGSLVRHGLITAQEHERFLGAVEELVQRDEYFYSITLYVYLGRPCCSGR